MYMPPPPPSQPPIQHVAPHPNAQKRMTPEQRDEYLHRLATDFEFFAAECLMVIPKRGGEPIPFIFNDAQKYLHREVERMRAEVGLVRIKGVKGRQQGFSTYVEGRFIWHAFRLRYVKVFILSHEKLATQNLFSKVKFFYNNAPDFVKPGIIVDSAAEYEFANGSEYKIATAGTKDTARSHTAQFMHRSERAFFPNIEALDAGVGQIVSYEAGTEIIDESTGNGRNHYYTEVMDAVKGRGRFRYVFVPWFWQREYREPVPPNFRRTEYEEQLVQLHGLDNQQLQWRRSTVIELKSVRKFRQEYPCTLLEAFQASGNSFYDADRVMAARKSRIKATSGAIIIGVDPAGQGENSDRTVIAIRRGVEFLRVIVYEPQDAGDEMWLAGIVAELIDYYRVRFSSVMCFIDAGYGHGTIARLYEREYSDYVQGVDFGGKASKSIYLNKRVEMNFDFREWLSTPGPVVQHEDVPESVAACGVSIPDMDEISVDLDALPDSEPNSTGKHTLVAKKKIVKDSGFSPDILDAMILTFAYPVSDRGESDYSARNATGSESGRPTSELTTRQDMYDNSTRFNGGNVVYGRFRSSTPDNNGVRGWTGGRQRGRYRANEQYEFCA